MAQSSSRAILRCPNLLDFRVPAQMINAHQAFSLWLKILFGFFISRAGEKRYRRGNLKICL